MPQSHTLKVTTPSDREIMMTRDFDAPRELVFEAYTRPELLKRWFIGPPDWELAVCEIDLRVGGDYRYLWRAPDGMEMGMRGTFREVVVPERLVSTEQFDQAWYPGEAVGTVTFADRDGRTTVTITVLYASREARDIALQSGMEQGVGMNFDRLEGLLQRN
jgi:uncharacterized protein YndB with AHSA1/START domain